MEQRKGWDAHGVDWNRYADAGADLSGISASALDAAP